MLVSIHVENSGQLLAADKPVSKQFTSDNRSKLLRGSDFNFLRRPYLRDCIDLFEVALCRNIFYL